MQVFLDTTAQDLAGNAVNAYQSSFNTESDPTTTAPTVVSYSPGYAVQNMPLNTVIDVGYSQPLDPTMVTPANVQLYLTGSIPVPVTVTLDPTGTVIHAVPNAALVANTYYYFYVQSGVQGTNGLPAQTLSYYFYTGASLATGATVVAVSPADKLGNVPVNANVRVRFSGPVDPLTVNGTTIQVSGGNQTVVPSAISFSENNQVVQITPNDVRPAATVMTLSIAGVTDLAGNVIPTQTTQFTTGVAPQTYTTYVINANPPSGQSNVPVNVAPSLQTSAVIDATSVNSNSFALYDTVLRQTVAATYSLSADGLSAYLLPNAPLAAGRAYNIYFNGRGIADLLGNSAVPCCGVNDFSFTTGTASDNQGPQVVAVSPANGLQQVPINALITVQFNEPVNSESLSQVTLSAGGGQAVGTQNSLSNANQTLSLVPLVTLAANTQYTLNITGVTDLVGNPMTPFTSSFTTGLVDFSQPVVANVFPANNTAGVLTTAIIQLQFSKFMNALTINSSTFTVLNGSTPIAGTIAVSPDGTIAIFTPSSALLTSTVYTVRATSSIVDLEGQALASFQSSFATQ